MAGKTQSFYSITINGKMILPFKSSVKAKIEYLSSVWSTDNIADRNELAGSHYYKT